MTAGKLNKSVPVRHPLDVAGQRSAPLHDLGEDLLVPFGVRPFAKGRVLWLNDRWFLESGVNSLDPIVRREIEKEFLSRFGVTAAEPGQKGDGGVLWADRYGAGNGALHGGSGRCGVFGAYNAKGVGRTPLVADNADWVHSSGCLWLSDAIRETIDAEIAAAELPYGAVPVIAIIDTGEFHPRQDGGADQRRAIVVRPNFIRPAHFERSIFFGDSGTLNSEQVKDARRTKEAIQFVSSHSPDGQISFDLSEMFLRFARQIGHGRAHRLWIGPFFTGNASIDGALVDFGSFRAVPSWRRASVYGFPGEAFGVDSGRIGAAIDSLCTYFRKYAVEGFIVPDPKGMKSRIENALDDAFKAAVGAVLHMIPESDGLHREIVGFFVEYYKLLQRESIFIGLPKRSWRRPWLYDSLGDSHALAQAGDVRVAAAFRDLLGRRRSHSSEEIGLCIAAVRRWLRPRPHMYRDFSGKKAVQVSKKISGNTVFDKDLLTDHISRTISKCRRVWSGLKPNIEVIGFITDVASSALFCREHPTGEECVYLDGYAVNGIFNLFGRPVRIDDIENRDLQINGREVRLRVPVQKGEYANGFVVRCGKEEIRIPRPAIVF